MVTEVKVERIAILVKGFAMQELRINNVMVASAIGVARVENMSNSFATYRVAIKNKEGFVVTQFYVDQVGWETR